MSLIYLVVYIFSLISVLGVGFLAGLSDYRGMTIPNYLPVMVVVAFFVAFGACALAGADIFLSIKSHLLSGLIVFVCSFVLFAVRAIGGGDSKLLAAYGIWVGIPGLPPYIFYTAFAGAFVALAAIVLKLKKPVKDPKEGSWVARVQAGESVVPYGIPIAIGAMIAFLGLGFVDPENLSLFLVSE